jgi:hypothetical protein
MTGSRMFRVRMRRGRALVGATSDGTEPSRAGSGEEVVVPESTAAFLMRKRAAELAVLLEPSLPPSVTLGSS